MDAERLIHSIKGAAGNMGAKKLHDRADELEKWYKPGNSGTRGLPLEDFCSELTSVLKSISTLKVEEEPGNEGITFRPFAEDEKTRVRQLYSSLNDQLENSDTQAVERIEELSRAFRGRASTDKISELRKLVENWDFDNALVLLENIAKDINI